MTSTRYPSEWFEEAFLIPGLNTGSISPETMRELFNELDIDRKGYIIRADVRRLMGMLGNELDETDIEEMMRLVDPQCNDHVTLEELTEAILNPGMLFFNAALNSSPNVKLPSKKDKIKASQSKVLDDVDLEFNRAAVERRELYHEVLAGTHLSAGEIKKIFARFQQVDKANKGTVKYPEFLRGMELQDSESSRRLFHVLDRNANGEVDMKEFIIGLSQFSDVTSEERFKFAFKLFDLDDSGFIERDELLKIVRASAPTWAQQSWLNRRVDELYDSLDLAKGSLIDFASFMRLARENPNMIAPSLLTTGTDF